jgi:hypothetical protein
MLASICRSQNFISHITIQPLNPDEPIRTESHSPHILAEFTSYYQCLLSTTTPDLAKPNLQDLYDNQTNINPDELSQLGDPISLSKIKRAIFSLPKDKVIGPDGFLIEFFQNY